MTEAISSLPPMDLSDAAEVTQPSHDRRAISQWRLSRGHFIATMQALDVFVIVTASAFGLERGFGSTLSWLTYVLASLSVALVVLAVFKSFGIYKFAKLMRGGVCAASATVAWLVAIGPVLIIILLHDPAHFHNRQGLFSWFLAGLASLCGLRYLVAMCGGWLSRAGILGDRICVVGEGVALVDCVKRILSERVGIAMLGYFGNPAPDGVAGLDGVARLGGTSNATSFLQRNRADTIIVAFPPDQCRQAAALALQLSRLPLRVLVAPWPPGANYCPSASRTRRPDLTSLMFLTLSERPLAGWRWIYKDVVDRSLAIVALLLGAPIMLAIAAAILISDGSPVLFRQTRHGYGGGTFGIFKFRTMYRVDSTASAGELRLTTRGDPRVFPIGRFLRRTSLDELPQLFNVILGDMWVVGPRPHPPQARAAGRIYAEVVDEYSARHRIKPGITGWAQVSGWRGPTETLEQITKRVEHDLYYIENWSVAFDLRILLLTLLRGFSHENAL